MLSYSALQKLRAAAGMTLVDRCTFKNKEGVVQGTADIPCRVQISRLTSRESTEGGRTTGTDYVDLVLPAETVVKAWYRAHVTFRTGETAILFVKGTPQPTTDETTRRVLCEKSQD